MPNKEHDQGSLPSHKRDAEEESKRMVALNEALAEPDAEKREAMLKELQKESADK